jgi:hypothetical protein
MYFNGCDSSPPWPSGQVAAGKKRDQDGLPDAVTLASVFRGFEVAADAAIDSLQAIGRSKTLRQGNHSED